MAPTNKHVLSFIPSKKSKLASKCFEAEQELSKYIGNQPIRLLDGLVRQCKGAKKHNEQLELCIELGFATCYFAKTGRITLEDKNKYDGIYNSLCNYGHNKEESLRAKSNFNRHMPQIGKLAYS